MSRVRSPEARGFDDETLKASTCPNCRIFVPGNGADLMVCEACGIRPCRIEDLIQLLDEWYRPDHPVDYRARGRHFHCAIPAIIIDFIGDIRPFLVTHPPKRRTPVSEPILDCEQESTDDAEGPPRKRGRVISDDAGGGGGGGIAP